MENFFNTDNVQRALKDCRKLVVREGFGNEFEKLRNKFITQIIDMIIAHPEEWDSTTQLNISYFRDSFLRDLNRDELTKYYLDIIFSGLFRFLTERYISSPGGLSVEHAEITTFARRRLEEFENDAFLQINYALNDMSLSMFKSLYNEEGLQAVRTFTSLKNEAERIITKWDDELKEKEKKVAELSATLTAQQDGFNFVGLHAGFAKLGRVKIRELLWSKIVMFTIGFIIPLLILTQTYLFYHFKLAIEHPLDLVKLLPGASITLLLLYYFRVSLANYSSIRAQIMQIELRKSLCRFIQRYSEYSSDINNKNPALLSKFEEVIFSNIMTSEDKIPSSFDGIEQIASLISSLKGK